MRKFDHLRWHLVLALSGALLIERLHWQIATGVIALIAVDRVVTWIVRLVSPARGSSSTNIVAVSERPLEPLRPSRRLSVSLKRALQADCPSCRGLGCSTCLQTGLR
jgi:hypothetical protein